MNQPIPMPALSDTMNNGRLVRWVKKIGDPIKKGESVADVETDKAVMDIEAFHDGYLAGPLAAEGSEMPVGATIGFIVDSPEAIGPAAAEKGLPPLAGTTGGVTAPADASLPPAKPSTLPARTVPSPAQPAAERVRASP